MAHDELNQWLVDDDAIVPSSGFAASVMEAVRREASQPPAIPFPWKRALPGLVALAVALLVTMAVTTAFAVSGSAGPAAIRLLTSAAGEVVGIAAAAVVAAAPLALSWRLMRV